MNQVHKMSLMKSQKQYKKYRIKKHLFIESVIRKQKLF